MGFGQLIDLDQQLGGGFDPLGPGALITAIGLGELAQAGAVLRQDRKEPGLPLLAARQDPSLMDVTLGTMAGGFAALSAQEVKGASRHGPGGLELAQETTQSGKGSPELLPLTREVGAQSALNSIITDTDIK